MLRTDCTVCTAINTHVTAIHHIRVVPSRPAHPLRVNKLVINRNIVVPGRVADVVVGIVIIITEAAAGARARSFTNLSCIITTLMQAVA